MSPSHKIPDCVEFSFLACFHLPDKTHKSELLAYLPISSQLKIVWLIPYHNYVEQSLKQQQTFKCKYKYK